jgi:hypothetical protein
MIKMIATTISNSINEKPFFCRFLIVIVVLSPWNIDAESNILSTPWRGTA